MKRKGTDMKRPDGISRDGGILRVCKQWILPLALALPGIVTVLYYILGPSKGYFTADCADSLLWAKASVESGKLISDSFYYAAVLPFGGNLIFAPFIALFGYTFTAQAWGMATFAVLLIAAMYYMATGIGLSRSASAGFISVCLLVLSSGAKLREIVWEHIFYYNLGILFFCLGFGLVLRILKEDGAVLRTKEKGDISLGVFLAVTAVCAAAVILCAKSLLSFAICFAVLTVVAVVLSVIFTVRARKGVPTPKEWVLLSVLCLFTVMASWNGLLSLVCFVLPVAAGICMERLLDKGPLTEPKSLKTLAVAGGFLFCALVGLATVSRVTGGVTAAYAEAYSEFSAMNKWVDNFLGFFNNWFSLLGVKVSGEIPFASAQAVLLMIRIFGGMLLLVYPLILLCRYRTLRSRGARMALIGHGAVLAFILFAVTFGRLGNANWRLTPALGTAVMATFIGMWDRIGAYRDSLPRGRVAALVCACLVLMSTQSFHEIRKMPFDYGKNDCWDTAAAELKQRGLRFGYATFWFAQPLNVASGDEVRVAPLIEDRSPPALYRYQVSADDLDAKGETRCFLLLCQTEMDSGRFDSFLAKSQTSGAVLESFTIQTGPYSIRGYEGDVMYVFVFDGDLF